ncbi:hypothetical protein ScPMuIL_012590 [Solemya velum]
MSIERIFGVYYNTRRKQWILVVGVFIVIILFIIRFDKRQLRHSEYSPPYMTKVSSIAETGTTYGKKQMEQTVTTDRKEQMGRTCQMMPLSYKQRNSLHFHRRLIYQEKEDILYCQIPKVGSTTIKKILHYIDAGEPGGSPFEVSLETVDSKMKYPSVKLMSDLKKFNRSLKFLFVRDPYYRLFSGFADKLFMTNNYYWQSLGKEIIRSFRKNPSESSKTCGHDVTFAEMVKYITSDLGKSAEKGEMKEKLIWLFDDKAKITKCMTFFEAMTRTWRTLQIRGAIARNVSMPFIESDAENMTMARYEEALYSAYDKSGSKAYRKKCQTDAMVEAYSGVPMEDLIRLQQVYRPDSKRLVPNITTYVGVHLHYPKRFDKRPLRHSEYSPPNMTKIAETVTTYGKSRWNKQSLRIGKSRWVERVE